MPSKNPDKLRKPTVKRLKGLLLGLVALNDAEGSCYDDNDEPVDINYGAQVADMVNQCGMNVLHELADDAKIIDQLASIADAATPNYYTENNYSMVTQIIFSDICGSRQSSKRWKAAKSCAIKGPVSYNLNSSNCVRMYMMGIPEIEALIMMLPKEQLKKYFPTYYHKKYGRAS